MLSGFHPTGKPVGFRHKFITKMNQLLEYYKKASIQKQVSISIPIRLLDKGQYLLIYNKEKESYLSVIKNPNMNNEKKYKISPIINGDNLYKSIRIINDAKEYINDYINTSLKCPRAEWLKLPYNKAVNSYLLSPNMNPEDFIRSLQTNNLSNMQKQFLKDVGIALQENDNSLTVETPEQRDDI